MRSQKEVFLKTIFYYLYDLQTNFQDNETKKKDFSIVTENNCLFICSENCLREIFGYMLKANSIFIGQMILYTSLKSENFSDSNQPGLRGIRLLFWSVTRFTKGSLFKIRRTNRQEFCNISLFLLLGNTCNIGLLVTSVVLTLVWHDLLVFLPDPENNFSAP